MSALIALSAYGIKGFIDMICLFIFVLFIGKTLFLEGKAYFVLNVISDSSFERVKVHFIIAISHICQTWSEMMQNELGAHFAENY